MRTLATFLVALLACSCCSAARPVDGAGDEQQAVAALVHRAHDKQYKTTTPIIGVLTQPCTDCPGK